jgi:A/G-specific adenine glycosylase
MNYAEIGRRLVVWHSQQQRSFPWRAGPAGQRDPYAVWVSEIMAQQTRLEIAAAYYARWLERFPTVEVLAAADQQEVLKLWQGLGYYARARNLHRAAQEIVASYNGHLPDTRAALLELPGVGEYTAGAILSMAFGQREPLLDGNVKRVFSRLANMEQPIGKTTALKELWRLARALVEAAPEGAAGAVNEALMELGATVCTPAAPRCLTCPLVDLCSAAIHGVQLLRPVTAPRRRTPHYDVAAGVIWRSEPFASPVLIAQRPQDGLLGGLWEFPGGKMEAGDADLQACLRREIQEELEIEIQVLEPLTTIRHAYTHFRITLHAFHARYMRGAPQALGCADWRWTTMADLDAFPFPATDQKVIRALRVLQKNNHPNG